MRDDRVNFGRVDIQALSRVDSAPRNIGPSQSRFGTARHLEPFKISRNPEAPSVKRVVDVPHDIRRGSVLIAQHYCWHIRRGPGQIKK